MLSGVYTEEGRLCFVRRGMRQAALILILSRLVSQLRANGGPVRLHSADFPNDCDEAVKSDLTMVSRGPLRTGGGDGWASA